MHIFPHVTISCIFLPHVITDLFRKPFPYNNKKKIVTTTEKPQCVAVSESLPFGKINSVCMITRLRKSSNPFPFQKTAASLGGLQTCDKI